MGNSKFKPVLGISVISGGRPEGSKHNLKFQSAIGIISNTFKVKIFFSCCLSFTALELFCHKLYGESLITLAIKILIHFIILGTKPTSTPGPKRDQLVLL